MREAVRRSRPLAKVFLCVAMLAVAAPRPAQGTERIRDGGEPSIPALTVAPAETDCPPDLEVLVERAFAARRELKAGDRIPITSRPDGPWCPATIAGVYEPRGDPAKLTAERPRLLLHLPHLARLLGRPDEADRFSLRVRPASDVDALRRALDGQLVGAQVVPTDEVVGRASTTFEVVRRFHRAIGWITLAAGGAFLACIMILKVQERRVSIAALRLIGTSRRTLVGWLVLEAALLSTMGGVLGIGIGLLASTIINRYYQWAYDTTLVFSAVTPEVLLQALGLALTLGLAAGAAAMLRLLAVHPLAEAGR